MKKDLFRSWIVFGLLAIAPAAYANVNLVTNGSFEPPAAGSGTSPAPGTCGVPGPWICSFSGAGAGNNVGLWSVQYGSGAFFGADMPADNAVGSLSPDAVGNGAVYLVDDGAPSTSPITETLSQNINVVSGQTYDVGFDLYEPGVGSGNSNQSSVFLSVGNSTYSPVTTNQTITSGLPWHTYNYLYTASSTGSVNFAITYDGGVYTGQDMLLDRGYAVSATPEPGFYGLMAAGLAGLVMVVRRRRTQML